MNDKSTLVSVLLLAMNHEKFIEQACNSIINQTYKNIEVIFLDNNSRDKTFEIGDKILHKSGIQYLSIKNTSNKGVSENLNIQANAAKGEYISILSGDDWYTNNNIDDRLNFLIENKLDVVLADGFKYVEDKKQIKNVYSVKRKNKVIKTITNYYETNLVNNITCNVGFFSKRDIIITHPFDTNLHTEDWDINLRLSKLNYKFGFLDKKTFYYRVLSTSLSHNTTLMKASFLKVTNKNLDKIMSSPTHVVQYQMRLLDFEILEIKNSNPKSTSHKHRLKKLQIQLNNLKYGGLKKYYKNFILFFK